MGEFDRENEPLFQDIHRNHRLSSATRVVGYIVPVDQAWKIAADDAAQRHSGDLRGMAVMVIATLVVICVTVAALV